MVEMVPVDCPEGVAPKICFEPEWQFQITRGVFLAKRKMINSATTNARAFTSALSPSGSHEGKFGASSTGNPHRFKAIDPHNVFQYEAITLVFSDTLFASHRKNYIPQASLDIWFLWGSAEATQQTSADHADRSGQDGPTLQPNAGTAL
jgi:hypothetical protein